MGRAARRSSTRSIAILSNIVFVMPCDLDIIGALVGRAIMDGDEAIAAINGLGRGELGKRILQLMRSGKPNGENSVEYVEQETEIDVDSLLGFDF